MSGKISRLRKRLEDIRYEIDALEQFRSTKQLYEFKRKLMGEYSYVKRQIEKLQQAQAGKTERKRKLREANRQRKIKNERSWGYFAAIEENYNLGLTKKQIRSEFSKKKRGLESSVPGIVWRNPSP